MLQDINWTIREGERWHLQGANGSGKTTLLSLITGDHPQSYMQPNESLQLFGRPRKRQATAFLAQQIGIASPEIFAAFPRRLGRGALTVRDVIATGFEGTFAYRPRSQQMDDEINELLSFLGNDSDAVSGWADSAFASLAHGEQAMVLLMRALAGKPPLLILDEVFAGMDDRMIQNAKSYLRERIPPQQAVIFVTHWEDELPWGVDDCRKVTLVDGKATIPLPEI